MIVDNFLTKLDKVRKTGKNSWRACCPGHNGNNPTALHITEADDGTVLLRCHTGCTVEQIVGSVGMDLVDLFPPTDTHRRKPERMPFNPRDVLAACRNESLLVLLCAKDIAAGRVLTDKEMERLVIAIGRLSAAVEAANAS